MHIQPVWDQEGFKIISFTKISPIMHIGYSLGGICSIFVGYHSIFLCPITVHPPVVRQMDAFILKRTAGEAQFIDVGVT